MTAEIFRWLLTGIITILVVANWFWIKRWINGRDEKEKEWEKQGGLVTREMYFAWCKTQQDKCPACEAHQILNQWRNGMLEKGGIMLKGEHTALCKEITKEVTEGFCNKIDALFEHHREWVAQELKLLRLEVTKSRDR